MRRRRGFRSRMRRLLDAVLWPPTQGVYRHRVPKIAPARQPRRGKDAR